jgi:hypothetical protein
MIQRILFPLSVSWAIGQVDPVDPQHHKVLLVAEVAFVVALAVAFPPTRINDDDPAHQAKADGVNLVAHWPFL